MCVWGICIMWCVCMCVCVCVCVCVLPSSEGSSVNTCEPRQSRLLYIFLYCSALFPWDEVFHWTRSLSSQVVRLVRKLLVSPGILPPWHVFDRYLVIFMPCFLFTGEIDSGFISRQYQFLSQMNNSLHLCILFYFTTAVYYLSKDKITHFLRN